jgi:hypothetical protein
VPQPASAVRDALVAKGMLPDDSHHHMYRKKVAGATMLVTRISHGANEINDGLAKLMANQCCLQLREFWNLIDCTLSAETWDDIVRERCRGGRNPFLGR